MKKGGQELLGGVDIKTARNGWGSQVSSGRYSKIRIDLYVDRLSLSRLLCTRKDYENRIDLSTVSSYVPRLVLFSVICVLARF